MINFRTVLQDKILNVMEASVGPGTDPTNTVVTFDNHLHDVDVSATPFIVVNVRTAEQSGASEIGNKYDLYMWTVHIYYISIEDDYNTGDAKRDNIMSRIEKTLEENRRLDNLESNVGGPREYVYDSSISAVLFDSSGEEDYYSFVSELYLNVYTAKG